MVFFCCSVCGDSLKKNQVQKHYSRCRMDMVSCMDCSTEFWNDDYQQHIKCISEEEKYSGKDYKPRPGQNKGEVKQDAWLQQIQRAIDNSTPSPKLRNLLERLKDYPNIPRKQAKFQNFVRNSMRVSDPKLVSSVWEIFMSAAEPKDKTNGKEENGENGNNVEAMKEKPEKNGKVEEEEEEEKVKKMSKREKKEERRKEKNKTEKKDKKQKQISSKNIDDEIDENQNEENDRPTKKKGKKRKQKDDLIENDVCEEQENGLKKSKKKKSNKVEKLEVIETEEKEEEEKEEEEEEEEREEEEESPPPKKHKTKFNWEQIILTLLKKSKENSMCEKKLRKKVLAEYEAQGCYIDSMSILKAKFDRKIKKNRRLVRKKDKVILID